MNDEIKEILEYLGNDNIEKPFGMATIDKHKLLDYITNLQQENEYLKLSNPEMNIEHFRIINENKRKIDNLRKQNKELQQENEDKSRCIKSLKDSRDWWQDRFFGQQEYDDSHRITAIEYKKRIYKAIEYIKEMLYPIGSCVNGSDLPYESIESLLNILQNGSEEK